MTIPNPNPQTTHNEPVYVFTDNAIVPPLKQTDLPTRSADHGTISPPPEQPESEEGDRSER
jgi:hypothetical protein